MSSYVFESCFAPFINDFILDKQQQGYLYESSGYTLWRFDRFCAENEVSDPAITKELTDLWVASFKGGLASATVAGRLSVLRQFALYMLSIGHEAYLPPEMSYSHPALSHVLSEAEIKALFAEIDSWEPDCYIHCFRRLAMEYRVIFRMLLCCGMRLAEVLKLHNNDVDLSKGILTVYCAKGHKDRLVYLSEDLRQLCCRYKTALQEQYHVDSVWFFPARDVTKRIENATIDQQFNRAWNKTEFADKCEKKPTVHSLRHTFVVMRMNRWMEADVPLEPMLPYLSKYLGHSSVEDTFYYYHQVDTAFKTVRKKDTHAVSVIPEVTAYEV